MSHLHHWKTLLGTRLALKWRCCPDCVHLVQTALLSWIERRAAGSAPLGFLQKAVLCTPGCSILQGFSVPVWCWELKHRNWLGLSARDWAPCVTHYGTSSSAWQQNCLSLRDAVKSCDTKVLHGVPSSVQALQCSQQRGHVPFQPELAVCVGDVQEWRLLGEVELLDKNYFGAVGWWAFWLLFPLPSDEISNSLWAALAFPVLQLCSLL